MITCKELPLDEKTLFMMSQLLSSPSALRGIDSAFVGYFNVFRLFCSVLAGRTIVFGAFGDTPYHQGMCFGTINHGTFECHLVFERHTPVMKILPEFIRLLKEHHPDVTAIVGYIDDKNRAAKLVARRVGCSDCGLTEERSGIRADGTMMNIRKFELNW